VTFISNIQGHPLDRDDNGFISRLHADGTLEARFIDGASPEVTLHAPKGLVVHEGLLYVTDIDRVRLFDATTGKPSGEHLLPGATFGNDLALAADGGLYVSDSGLDRDFHSTGTDAVYTIRKGKVKVLLRDRKLAGPNGLLADEGGVWVVGFGGNELSFITDKGQRERVQSLPQGSLDGLQRTRDGVFLISSWESGSVFAGKPGGEFVELLTGLTSPADLGYDAQTHTVWVPLFQKDQVLSQRLSEPTLPEPEVPPGESPGAPAGSHSP